MQKKRNHTKLFFLILFICIGGHTSSSMEDPQVLYKEMKNAFQQANPPTTDPELLRIHGLIPLTEQQIAFQQRKLRREERAIQFLQNTRLVPVTSINVATVIYLEDNVGVKPTITNIITTLNFLGLESAVFPAAEKAK